MTKHISLVLVLAAVIAGTAAAQSSSTWFGPQVGFYKAKDADNARIMGGVALRLKSSGMLGVEGSINYRVEKYNTGFVTVRSWPVMLTGLVYLMPFAYGAIGAGWYNSSIDYNIPSGILGGPYTITGETAQKFGWHFGGGVELPLGSAAVLVGDIKYVFLDYNFRTFPGTNGLNSNFYVLTAGLFFGL